MVPSKPNQLRVTAQPDGYLLVDWKQNPANENVVYYYVYRGASKNFIVGESSLIAQCDTNHFLDMDVTGSTTYFYRIVAVDDSANQGPLSDVAFAKTPWDNVVEQVTLFCYLGILILISFVLLYDGRIFDHHAFTLSIDGNPTFTSEKLSGIMNNENNPKTLTIYGINNTLIPNVYSSNITDKSGNLIIPFAAKLSNQNTSINLGAEKGLNVLLQVNRNTIKPGLFEGMVLIQDNETSPIPIRLATEPMIIQAVVIVGIGILTSIILWEFIKYFRKNNDHEQREQLMDKSRRDIQKTVLYLNYLEPLKRRRNDFVTEFENVAMEANKTRRNLNFVADKRIDELPQDLAAAAKIDPKKVIEDLDKSWTKKHEQLTELRNNIIRYDAQAEKIRNRESLYRVSAEVNRQAADSKTQKIESYKSRSLRRRSLWSKIVITEFGSALFGISIGVFGLLTNDYVLGLRSIEPMEIIVLFGLGLGIGSLKEFVDK